MKFTAIQDHLAEALQTVGRAISNKNTIPLLNGIHLRCQNNQLTLTATDLELRIACHMPVEEITAGETVVSGKAFTDLVRRLPDGPVLFESTNHNGHDTMHIVYGSAESEMQGWSGQDFPDEPDVAESVDWTIPAPIFKNLIRHTAFTVRPDEIRPIFTGLFFEVRGHDVTVVGTDSFRLSLMKDKINNVSGEDIDVIIPVRALSEVSRMVGDEDLISVHITDTQVIFDMERIRLVAQRIKGDFPPYKRVIPESYNTFCKLKRKDLQSSIDRAIIFSQERDGTPAIFMRFDGGLLHIHTESETGMVNEKIEIYQEGDAVDITFNSHFLSDALKNIGYDDLDVTLSGSVGPCVMRPANEDRYLYLLLPLRR